MDNLSCLSAAYDLVDEAVTAVWRGKIVYMNQPAISRFGRNYTGKNAGELLPVSFINSQMANFVSSAVINEKKYIVRASAIDDISVYLFACEPESAGDELTGMLSIMRTNLANIKLAFDKLQSYCPKDPAALDYAAILSHNYYLLKRLVTNLSTVNCLIHNDMPVRPAVTDLNELCSSLVSASSHFAAMDSRELSFSGDGALLCNVDRELIEQLLLNLITNSLQHTPRGGQIKVTIFEAGDLVNLSVSDTGEGVPPAMMNVIFAKYRNHFSLSDLANGLGLGLTIARGIAELHGGSLLLESRPGGGTVVRVTLSKTAFPGGTFSSHSVDYNANVVLSVLSQLSPVIAAKNFSEKYED